MIQRRPASLIRFLVCVFLFKFELIPLLQELRLELICALLHVALLSS